MAGSFQEHRIGDRSIIRSIPKRLKVGILEEGVVTVSERGTGQGAVISPLLANVYLHYVLDLWAERWRRREATGDMIIVRYADDFIVGFQHEEDARRFLDTMRQRLQEFALSLHPEKTRLIEFGRLRRKTASGAGLASRKPSPSWASSLCPAKLAGVNSRSNGIPTGPYAAKVASHQTGTAAAHASVDPRTRKVAEAGRHRLLQLSRGADKRSDTDRVSFPRHQPMATHAAAAKSEGLDDQGTDRAVGQRLAPKTANPSPLARCALCSQTPKVGAVCPNWADGSVRGARGNSRLYRDRGS